MVMNLEHETWTFAEGLQQRTCGSACTASHVGQYRRDGRAAMYFMYLRQSPQRDRGRPLADNGLKDASNSMSILEQGSNYAAESTALSAMDSVKCKLPGKNLRLELTGAACQATQSGTVGRRKGGWCAPFPI